MDALKQLHTSIADTFEKCFDNAYKNLKTELATYDACVNDAEARAKAANEANQELESEIRNLRHEMSILQGGAQSNYIDSTHNEPHPESLELDEIYEPSRVLRGIDTPKPSAERLETISKRYLELYGQAGMFLEASVALRRQVKSHKRKLEHLQSFFRRQEFTLTLGGQVIRFHRIEQKPTQTSLLEVTELAVEAEVPTQGPVALTSTASSPVGEHAYTAERQRGSEDSRQDTTPSDASTVESPPIPLAASGTQRHEASMQKHLGGQPGLKHRSSSKSVNGGGRRHPIIFKSETMSSSPIMAYSSHPAPPGTQDLDDIGDTVVTPTKRIRYRKDSRFQSYTDNPQSTVASSSGPVITQQEKIDGKLGPGVLQPVHSNSRIPRSPYQTPNNRQKRDPSSIKRLSALTEDGDENLPQGLAQNAGISAPEDSRYAQNSSSRYRLSNLLEQPSPSSKSLQPNLAISKSSRKRTRSPEKGGSVAYRTDLGTTSTTTPATSEYSRGSPNSRARHPLRGVASQTDITPEDEPYRVRPLHRLALDHFRINPDHNQGLNFAYDEVVRSRDERKCVSGCTRPGCCGDKFLAMARFGISTATSGRSISDSEILKAFLGESEHSFGDLSPKERQDLLERAKARHFSDRFGRHRHQHHRPGTPPGFWRTDMPGTQEIIEDREQAQKLEREKVEERYREAMRPGGRWMFADE
ncbi:DNA repair protein endonuclease SAE2/CtIP C-terminus-domain-containing protein [Aspergillus heterothallicus]